MRFSVGSAHVGIALVTLGSFAWQLIRFHPHRLGPDAAGSQDAGEDFKPTTRGQAYAAISWALGACLAFGLTHWWTGVLQDETLTFSGQAAIDRAGAIEFMCIMSGLLSSLFSYTLLTRPGGRALACEYHEVLGLKDGVPSVANLLVGAVHFLPLSVQRHVLEQDLTDAGPLLTIEQRHGRHQHLLLPVRGGGGEPFWSVRHCPCPGRECCLLLGRSGVVDRTCSNGLKSCHHAVVCHGGHLDAPRIKKYLGGR